MSKNAIAILILAFVFPPILFYHGFEQGKKSLLEDAIKNGVAEYYLDENNERQARWVDTGERIILSFVKGICEKISQDKKFEIKDAQITIGQPTDVNGNVLDSILEKPKLLPLPKPTLPREAFDVAPKMPITEYMKKDDKAAPSLVSERKDYVTK